MNAFHAMALISRTVLETGTIEPKDVYVKLRGQIDGPGAQIMTRPEIESFASQCIQQLKAAKFPLERELMLLRTTEAELRADLVDLINTLDRTSPRDLRDLHELCGRVLNSDGEPSLQEAVDYLAASGQVTEDVVAGLTGRLLALFPPAKDDDAA